MLTRRYQLDLLRSLQAEVGAASVLFRPHQTRRYRRGYRGSPGQALAVVRPSTLVELWRTLKILLQFDVAIVIQAANTGLTGGSTPDDAIGRPVVIISTMRIAGIRLILDGTQVVCLPGATLYQLERTVRAVGREPHSVIGSSCFGASVIGGVCNNSGGALVQRGPAYTEMSIFGQVGTDGTLRLINHLGIELGDDPEVMLERLENGVFDVQPVPAHGSDPDYHHHVRALDEPTPARYNADPRRLCDASGSAGRVVVFAVRLDTFAQDDRGATFYIGTNDPKELSQLRRQLLSPGRALPVSAEYIHAYAFDIADRYGRDVFVSIRAFGTDRLPRLYALKARVNEIGEAVGVEDLSERLPQLISRTIPDHLPSRIREWRDRYEHHLILTVNAASLTPTRQLLGDLFPSNSGGVFECSAEETEKALLHRFVTAGAAVRYRAIHGKSVSGLVALDVAIPRNAEQWWDTLPAALDQKVVGVLRYGHFLCHVFHRDYLIARGADPQRAKKELLLELDRVGARYPAEHNVGRQYRAPPELADFYHSLDPTNRLNPGIGMTSVEPNWADVLSRRETIHD